MRTPLKYNNEILGYLSDYKLNEDGSVQMLKFFLYDRSWFDNIFYDGLIRNIERSACLTLDKNPDLNNIDNNKLFQYDLIDKDDEKFLLIRAI